MGQKDQCKDELRLIRRRNEPEQQKGWVPRTFCENCNMFRFVHAEDFDDELAEILPQAFADPKLSVLVECAHCKFTPFDIGEEFEKRSKVGVVGVVVFKARSFMGRWELHDDPHPYERQGQMIQEHPNHAQVICEKGFTDAEGLKALCSWVIEPKKQTGNT